MKGQKYLILWLQTEDPVNGNNVEQLLQQYCDMKALIGVLLIWRMACVGIPLSQRLPRCMMAYTDEDHETLKLDIAFPLMPGQLEGEKYEISVTNTETKDTSYDAVSNGEYKKELIVDKNHVYKICFRILTNRDMGIVTIDYNAEVEYSFSAENIKVPENLLKDQQTKETYVLAERMDEDLKRYQTFKENKRISSDENFETMMKQNSRMINISYIELALILGVGLYQFFTIRNFLVHKHYL